MANRNDSEREEHIRRLEAALARIFDESPSKSQTLKSYAKAIEEAEERTRTVNSQLDRLAKVLSRGDQEKLLEESKDLIRTINSTTKKFTDSELDAIQGFESLKLAINELEDEYKSLTELTGKHAESYDKIEKRLARSSMSNIRREMILEDARKKYLTLQAKENGLTEEHLNVVLELVPKIREQVNVTDQNINAMSKLRVGFDKLSDRINENAKDFFSVSGVTRNLKKALTGSYEELNRLTTQGFLGAFMQIQVASKTLFVSTEQLQKAIQDNRNQINTRFGGGAEGVKQFTDEVHAIQSQLLFLGKHSGEYALELETLAAQTGNVTTSGELYQMHLDGVIKDYKQMHKMFGMSAAEYRDIIEHQQNQESVMARLSVLQGRDLLLAQRELRLRTENLKHMGFSNEQVKEFNSRLENMFDPKKNTYQQQVREAVYTRATFDETERMLMQMQGTGKSDEENKMLASALVELQKNRDRLYDLTQAYSLSPEEKQRLHSDPETLDAKRAYARATNIVTQKNSALDTTTLNVLRERAGITADEAQKTGDARLESEFRNRGISGDAQTRDAHVNAVSAKNALMQGEGSTTAVSLEWQSKIYETISRWLESPLVAAGKAALAAAGALWLLTGSALPGIGKGKIPGGKAPGGVGGAPKGSGTTPKGGTVPKGVTAGGVAGGALKFGAGAAVGIGAGYAAEAMKDGAEDGSVRQGAGISTSVLGSAATGAGTGAMIGSVIPFVGTAIGGVIGGIAGAALGIYQNKDDIQKFDTAKASKSQQTASTRPNEQPGPPTQRQGQESPSASQSPRISQQVMPTSPYSSSSPTGSVSQTIAKHEGDYGSFNRGNAGDSMGKQIDFSKMTISEVMAAQSLPRNHPDRLFAVGKYQIIPSTMKEAVKSLKISGNEKFTPELQEKIFLEHLTAKKRPQIEGFIKGRHNNLGAASIAGSLEWASIEHGRSGKSYYDKTGNNRAGTSSVDFERSLSSAKSKYLELTKKGYSEEDAYAVALGSKTIDKNGSVVSAVNSKSVATQVQTASASQSSKVTSPETKKQEPTVQLATKIQKPQDSAIPQMQKSPDVKTISDAKVASDKVSPASLSTVTPMTSVIPRGNTVEKIDPSSVVQETTNNNSTVTNNEVIQDSKAKDTSGLDELKKQTDLLSRIAINTTGTRNANPNAYQRDRASVLNGTS